MCGILATERTIVPPESLKVRGKDGFGYACNEITRKKIHFYHYLHAMVSNIEQPFEGNGMMVCNCEIYNWKEMSVRHGIDARNDSELIFKFMEGQEEIVAQDAHGNYHAAKALTDFIRGIEGSYAIIYAYNDKIIAFRDPLGIRQLSYDTETITIGSTPGILKDIGVKGSVELHPRRMLIYDSQGIHFAYIPFSFPLSTRSFIDELSDAVRIRMPDSDFGILFSGGIDSLLIAAIAKKHSKHKVHLINVSTKNSSDRKPAEETARMLGMELTVIEPDIEESHKATVGIGKGIDESNSLKIRSAIPTWIASKYASSIGLKVLITGFGADEILAGYLRGKSNYQRGTERFAQLLTMWEANMLKEDVSSMSHTIELRYPYLSFSVISSAWREHHDDPKTIIRLELERMGLPSERKKVASHYGSGINEMLKKANKHNADRLIGGGKKIAALISTGKDSIFAAHLLRRFNYELGCMITIHSKNKDSFMYHTPATSLSEDISNLIGIPLVSVQNDDGKEEELGSLREGIANAMELYGIKGISSGAIQSNYQRTRLLLICEEFGLSMHSPLWQTDTERYARSLIKSGFRIIITRCSAEGLDIRDCGREYDDNFIEKLRKNNLSLVGEGGEFETLVTDCPLYHGRILIKRHHVEDRGNDYILIIDEHEIERR
jgi:diphthine-ammonia ligase